MHIIISKKVINIIQKFNIFKKYGSKSGYSNLKIKISGSNKYDILLSGSNSNLWIFYFWIGSKADLKSNSDPG